MNKLIALLTDFGNRGQHYVASMKGVILDINLNVNIIDVCHTITPYSVINASYILYSVYRYFPKNSIFIIVVDPGVGSSREIILLQTNSGHTFVGPNNGLFTSLIMKENIVDCREITNSDLFRKPVSNTFHGRDIMAPVGAYISKGISVSEVGPEFDLSKIRKYEQHFEVMKENREVTCLIQNIDSFGNITTTLSIKNEKILGTPFSVKNNQRFKVIKSDLKMEGIFTSHFSKSPIGSLLFIKGSTGFLELSINQGSAADQLEMSVGNPMTIKIYK